MKLSAVVEDHRHVINIEHMTPDGEHVAIGRDQETALIDGQAMQAAGAEDFDDLRLHLGDDAGERRAGEGGAGKEDDAKQR